MAETERDFADQRIWSGQRIENGVGTRIACLRLHRPMMTKNEGTDIPVCRKELRGGHPIAA